MTETLKHRENSAKESISGEDHPLLEDQPRSNPNETSEQPLLDGSVLEQQQESVRFPRSVFFIIGQEFCERFSFYGMKTVLYLYLTNFLLFNDATATTVLHVFVMFAYFFPLVGGILSDSLLGKYKTILILSVVYACGSFVLALTAIPGVTGNPPHWWGLAVGLLLLAIGTGGIKPCVSAFGGDQFHPSQTRAIGVFFSMFYFSVNLGSVLSTIITPELRSLSCYGGDSCYPLAFGVPAILMIVATLIFVAGSRHYKKVPPGGNIVAKVSTVIFYAIGKRGTRDISTPHWLDVAVPKYGKQIVDDTKTLLGVLFMLLPVPLFWALFDQQSSRWVAQGNLMNPILHIGSWELDIKPEQLQAINPLLVVLMIPVFEKGIYPLIERVGIRFTMLRRIGTGMFIAGCAFLIAALLQVRIDQSHIEEFVRGDVREKKCVANCVGILWQFPQYFVITFGEILVAVTGLEFGIIICLEATYLLAYSEAPESMKSVCQAAWLLTVSIGNLLVAIIAGSQIFKQAAEFVFFAFIIFAAALAFGLMARMYQYKQKTHEEILDIVEDE